MKTFIKELSCRVRLTDDIEQAIHRGHDVITDFLKDETASFLTFH